MKRAIFTIIAVFAISTFSVAQNGAFKEGDKLLNIGIGPNTHYDGGIPFGASLEFGIPEEISVGVNVNYLSHKYMESFKFNAIYLSARANYHFNKILKITNDHVDVYGGLSFGYRKLTWKEFDPGISMKSTYRSGMIYGAQVGLKYYFSENIGAVLEVGELGLTNALIGVAFKF